MSSTAELAGLYRLVNGARRCAMPMQARNAGNAAIRRLVNVADGLLNDVERLEIDAEFDRQRGAARQRTGQKMAVPDTRYDTDFCREVGDEGVGGQSGTR